MPQHAGNCVGRFHKPGGTAGASMGKNARHNPTWNATMSNTMEQRPPQADRVAYTVEEASQLCTLSTRTLRNYIKSGQLQASRFGQRVVIPRENLLRFINSGDRPEARNG